MAYQKLQVGTGVSVIPSDTIDIPNVSGPSQSGTATGTTANKLVDSTGGFTNNLIGYIVYNTTDNTAAYVTSVDDDETLSLSADIMASGEAYVLYADANTGCVLYVGNTGNLHVLTSGGADLTFVGIPAGSFVPVQVKRVFATDTTATDIIALW
jgi:hypothetical protein